MDLVTEHSRLQVQVRIIKGLTLQQQQERQSMRPRQEVISAGYAGNAGNLLVISHGNGLLTYYMHCNAIYVSAGQKVSRGQNVAAVGTTGNSTGPHLHFQVMLNGTPVNPANYL